MKMNKFWVVWNPNAGAPTFRHPTREQALAEAERLAARNPNAAFVVLEALTVSRAKTVVTETLSEALPFRS